MSYDDIRWSVADHVATLVIDRPARRNALRPHSVDELCDALDHIDADPDVRVVVVTGEGRDFCAGADLAAGGATFDPAADPSKVTVTADGRHRDKGGVLALRLFNLAKPVIAAVHGAAVGIGATMLLPMDVRLASTDARFGFVFARRGIVPEACSSWFLPRVVGISRAMEWCATGRVFGAEEALAGGLVRSLHAPDDLLPAAYELAAEMAASAPVSVAVTRALLWRNLGEAHPMAAHRLDSPLVDVLGASPDGHEGVTSFLEKRPADFPGRVPADLPALYPWWEEPEF